MSEAALEEEGVRAGLEGLFDVAFYESEAAEQESIILGDTEAEVAAIEGDALEEAKRIRGQADAEAIRLYAEALNQGPEFYGFLRRLEMLVNSVDTRAEMILTTDGELFSLIKEDENKKQ